MSRGTLTPAASATEHRGVLKEERPASAGRRRDTRLSDRRSLWSGHTKRVVRARSKDGGERLGEAWVRAHRRSWPGCLCRMAQPAASASCLSQLPQNSGEFTSHVRCVPVGVQRIGGSSLAGSSVSGLSFSGLSLSGIPVSGIPVSELFGHHSPRPLTSGVREFPSQRLPGWA